jgi:hypothetical protein
MRWQGWILYCNMMSLTKFVLKRYRHQPWIICRNFSGNGFSGMWKQITHYYKVMGNFFSRLSDNWTNITVKIWTGGSWSLYRNLLSAWLGQKFMWFIGIYWIWFFPLIFWKPDIHTMYVKWWLNKHLIQQNILRLKYL